MIKSQFYTTIQYTILKNLERPKETNIIMGTRATTISPTIIVMVIVICRKMRSASTSTWWVIKFSCWWYNWKRENKSYISWNVCNCPFIFIIFPNIQRSSIYGIVAFNFFILKLKNVFHATHICNVFPYTPHSLKYINTTHKTNPFSPLFIMVLFHICLHSLRLKMYA